MFSSIIFMATEQVRKWLNVNLEKKRQAHGKEIYCNGQ